jgi:nitrile hydratase accessory protein
MNQNVSKQELDGTPLIPKDEEGPVFMEPWQARAFAMTLKMAEAKVFTWGEWCEALSGEIKLAQAAGDPDLGDTYYVHWLGALEKLTIAKEVSSDAKLKATLEDWRAADHARAHGEAPVFVKGAGTMGHGHHH